MNTIEQIKEACEILVALSNMECVCPVHLPAGCQGGDCDGCPACLAGRTRRLVSATETS